MFVKLAKVYVTNRLQDRDLYSYISNVGHPINTEFVMRGITSSKSRTRIAIGLASVSQSSSILHPQLDFYVLYILCKYVVNYFVYSKL